MGCLGFSLAAGFRPLLFTVVGSSSWHNHANGSGPRLCCDQVSWEWGSGTVCRYGTRPAPVSVPRATPPPMVAIGSPRGPSLVLGPGFSI